MTRDTIKRLARIGLWLAMAGAYVMAIMPGNPHIFHYDKANHGLAFFVMAVLARLGFSRAMTPLIAIGLIAFGAFIELSQALPIIARDASWADLGADTIATFVGLLAGSVLLMAIRRHRPE